MFRIDFFNFETLAIGSKATARFSYSVCAGELPVLLAEWIVSKATIAEIVAAVTADVDFTTWHVRTESADFPRAAIRPVVPVV